MKPIDLLIKLAKGQLKMTPLKHQLRVSKKISKDVSQLVFHGLGSGKTFTAITSAHSVGIPLVVIAPASLRENFKKEIKQSGFTGKSEVISYNEAVRDMDKKSFQKKISKSMVVFDEVHNAGRSESKTSTLMNVLNPAKVLMLTGTPIRNYPHELVPLMVGLKVKNAPTSMESFNKKFIKPKDLSGFREMFSRILFKYKGEQTPKNLKEFKRMMKGKVDYFESFNPKDYPNVKEEFVKVDMSKKHLSAYDAVMNMNAIDKMMLEYNINPDKIEGKGMQSFMIGPRMASNTPSAVSSDLGFADSSKIRKMVSDLSKAKAKDKKFKAMVYSNFLDTGIKGIAQKLKKKGIDYDLFTGEMSDKQKKAAVEKYNKSKSGILLVSGAGAEGIDLKGTKMVQIMEPHWNNARINQAIGRAARYKSHSHLPKKDRNVLVKKYVSTIPAGWLTKWFGIRPRLSADEMLYNLSKRKDEINKPFLDILKGEKK